MANNTIFKVIRQYKPGTVTISGKFNLINNKIPNFLEKLGSCKASRVSSYQSVFQMNIILKIFPSQDREGIYIN
jgi:hypothetical protein